MLLFRPFCTCSCTRWANQKHSSHGASCRTFTLGTVLQHHPHATERNATLRFAQRRKIALKIFLEGCRLCRLFQSSDHNSTEAWAVPFYEGYTSPDTFFSLTFTKERILCIIICHPVTKGRKYVCRSCLLHFNSPDLNSKHPRLSAQEFFFLVSLYSCIWIEKKLVLYTLLNHGKA
jgi:hypothetical protein